MPSPCSNIFQYSLTPKLMNFIFVFTLNHLFKSPVVFTNYKNIYYSQKLLSPKIDRLVDNRHQRPNFLPRPAPNSTSRKSITTFVSFATRVYKHRVKIGAAGDEQTHSERVQITLASRHPGCMTLNHIITLAIRTGLHNINYSSISACVDPVR